MQWWVLGAFTQEKPISPQHKRATSTAGNPLRMTDVEQRLRFMTPVISHLQCSLEIPSRVFKRPLSIVHTMMAISYTGFTLTWSILGQWQSGVKNLGLSLGCFRTEEAFWMRGNIFTNQKETRLPSLQLSSLQIVFRLWGNSQQQDQWRNYNACAALTTNDDHYDYQSERVMGLPLAGSRD